MLEQGNTSSVKDRTNQSLAWKHFEKIPDSEEAKCCLCSTMLAFRRSSTKGLWDHLKSKHKEEYMLLKQDEMMPRTNEFKLPKRKAN